MRRYAAVKGTKKKLGGTMRLLAAAIVLALASPATAQTCPAMRKINIGVAVAPPNVVHTAPYVAKALGFFSKHCVEANIIQFDGGAAGRVSRSGGSHRARRKVTSCRPR